VSEAKKSGKRPAPKKKATTKKASSSKSSARPSGKGSAKPAPKKPSSKGAAKLTKKTRTSLPPPAIANGTAIRRAESRKLALELVAAGLDKKAERIEVIDVAERVDYADYVVLMSGRSDVQLAAIAQSVEDALKKHGKHPQLDGRRGAAWIVLDCGDVWVHAFLEDARKYYDIEGLWMDAPRVDLPKDMAPKRTSLFPPPSESDAEDDR
jgi:ribosome-associated protein